MQVKLKMYMILLGFSLMSLSLMSSDVKEKKADKSNEEWHSEILSNLLTEVFTEPYFKECSEQQESLKKIKECFVELVRVGMKADEDFFHIWAFNLSGLDGFLKKAYSSEDAQKLKNRISATYDLLDIVVPDLTKQKEILTYLTLVITPYSVRLAKRLIDTGIDFETKLEGKKTAYEIFSEKLLKDAAREDEQMLLAVLAKHKLEKQIKERAKSGSSSASAKATADMSSSSSSSTK